MRHFRIPILDRLEHAVRSFSFVERVFFYLFVLLFVGSSFAMLGQVNAAILVEVPARGGAITEGILGAPRFINPLLATSDADRDLTQLVYAGLMKATPEGTLIPELAQTYTISDDGRTYTFTLKEGARFHDDTPVTAEDVAYTVALAQNPDVKSSKRANWEGVRVDAIDARTVTFTLSEPYQPFLENTTLGIIPKHIWEATTPEQLPFNTYNAEPVGAGSYRVTSLRRNDAGVPTQYTLEAFDDYVLGAPFVTTITLRFYTNETDLVAALEKGSVNQVGAITPEDAERLAREGYRIETFPLPRIFAVFFNQNQAAVFTNIEVRKALSVALSRDTIVAETLSGYGTAIDGPLPPGLAGTENSSTDALSSDERIAEAQDILERNGWTLDDSEGIYVKKTKKETILLAFTIATANTPELKAVADSIAASWRRAGARVAVELFDIGNLNNEVIRPREYQALLFGQIIGRDLDPFPFWHSSQRNDPGLNIALYTNITVDTILENIRTTFDPDTLGTLYHEFREEINNDIPAVFVYTPDFLYVIDRNLKGFALGTVTTPAERFLNINEWYFHTDRVWPVFVKTKN